MSEGNSATAGAVPLAKDQAPASAMKAATDDVAKGYVGEFEIYADRRQPAYIAMRSGLSHKGGSIQHVMKAADARALALGLLDAAEFAEKPSLSARIAASIASKNGKAADTPASAKSQSDVASKESTDAGL